MGDNSFFGVTGFSRSYQAVYKLLRSVVLLRSLSVSTGITEPLEGHRKELTTLYEVIMEMHHIHPLLQDELLLSRGLET
ncbi:hypothetical protein BSL78_26522 [Apostichopus japonicus]|uniref:Uncharacterized protein n=1 Tax=Stichopus japonicus TaxID=307972 RepID=A0A2G8JLR4_STIJA|nr:hypothetical protein BSL78_26522 [Apostichopus japonicus]